MMELFHPLRGGSKIEQVYVFLAQLIAGSRRLVEL